MVDCAISATQAAGANQAVYVACTGPFGIGAVTGGFWRGTLTGFPTIATNASNKLVWAVKYSAATSGNYAGLLAMWNK